MTVKFSTHGGYYQSGPSQGPDSYALAGRIFNPPADRPYQDTLTQLAHNPNLANDLESDLALAYYFSYADQMFLLRDGCGLTPLFYAKKGPGWAFAFTLDELFKILGQTPEIDEQTFYDFTATHYRYVFRDPGRAFHQGVRQVVAGHYLLLDREQAIEKRWLKMDFAPEPSKASPQQASERYVELLDQNVNIRLKALENENIAFTISSGLDSSTVAALAARKLKGPLNCFFAAYSEQANSPYDESQGVNDLIKATGWHLNRIDLGAPDLLKETENLLKITKAPIITVTWLAHYVLAKNAYEQGHRYLFSGLGGDESLAGEFEHFFCFFADLKDQGLNELLATETEAWVKLHDHPVFKKSPEVRDEWFRRWVDFKNKRLKVNIDRYSQNQQYFNQEWIKQMESQAPPIPMPHPYPWFLSNRLYQEMNYETSTPTLWSEALSSQAAGVKGIFPMASPKLLSLALNLPGTFKYQNGLTKMILRRALKGILPDSSRLNPVKTGFNAPLDLWLLEPKLSADCLELLTSSPFKDKHWLAPKAAERIIKEHKSGLKNHMMLLWPLICSAIFLKINR
ncbi:MAG: hypothetical protein LBV23_08450 [Deltaproteobacteria bacterium]|jgi:asparagine synthase (glutamine-hydrolysing)|nr:hypothetical protein [Deltaproteobacteria bacterium]